MDKESYPGNILLSVATVETAKHGHCVNAGLGGISRFLCRPQNTIHLSLVATNAYNRVHLTVIPVYIGNLAEPDAFRSMLPS